MRSSGVPDLIAAIVCAAWLAWFFGTLAHAAYSDLAECARRRPRRLPIARTVRR